MTRKVFFELVEMKAKTASVFPFLMGVLYSLKHFHTIQLAPLFLYFVAMFLFNMFVDIWDNYNDYIKAVDTIDYQQNTNIIGREEISLVLIRKWLGFLFFSSLVLGIIVSFLVGWEILVLGFFCYLVGVFYSGGPKPLSSLPVGEVFSGLTMGFFIFLICVFINSSQEFVWNFSTVASIFCVSLPNVLLISNLMLANNTCDLEEDESNHRYTLVHYLGKQRAIILWKLCLLLSFFFLAASIILGLLPKTLLVLVAFIPFFWKKSKPYFQKQTKRETFIISIKNLAIFSFLEVVLFFLGILI